MGKNKKNCVHNGTVFLKNKGSPFHTCNITREDVQEARVLWHEVEIFPCLKMFMVVLYFENRKNVCIHNCILCHN